MHRAGLTIKPRQLLCRNIFRPRAFAAIDMFVVLSPPTILAYAIGTRDGRKVARISHKYDGLVPLQKRSVDRGLL